MNLDQILVIFGLGGFAGAIVGISWAWSFVTAIGLSGFLAFIAAIFAYLGFFGALAAFLGGAFALLLFIAVGLALRWTDWDSVSNILFLELPKVVKFRSKGGRK